MADPSQPPGQDSGAPAPATSTSTATSLGPPAEQVSTAGGSFGGPQQQGGGEPDSEQGPSAVVSSGEQAVAGVATPAEPAPSADGGSGSAPSEEDVLDALSNVIDPELGLDFVELGLIYGVELTGGDVRVTFTLTTPACPIGPHVTEQIEEFVGELEGVKSVSAEMVFIPPWSPERMSEDAKFALGF
jgi:metal-sulfur cluster biosynthetic enzyme